MKEQMIVDKMMTLPYINQLLATNRKSLKSLTTTSAELLTIHIEYRTYQALPEPCQEPTQQTLHNYKHFRSQRNNCQLEKQDSYGLDMASKLVNLSNSSDKQIFQEAFFHLL